MSHSIGKTPDFNRECKAFPNKRVIMVTPNIEYWDMFLNWFHFAKAYLGKTDQLVVVAEDQQIEAMLRNSSFVFMDMNGTLSQRANANHIEQESAPYGTPVFRQLVGKRAVQILHFLELGCTVLYTDVDTVWRGDVFQDIAAAGPHDLYITDDSRNNIGMANVGEGWNFCTCFLYLQPYPAVRELMQSWHQAQHPPGGNQLAFNKVLRTEYETRGLLDFAVLPHEAFPPGCYVDRKGAQPSMHMLHANFRSGIAAKRQFMVDHDVWVQ
jgi:hypothetical protein